MARPSNYLSANLNLQDTFAALVERSNEHTYDLGTIVVTTAPVTQANNTNGALTAGNAHIQGFFSANTLIASDQLRGGTIDTSAVLVVTSNASFTGARVFTSDTTIADFGANVTLSSASANNFTKHLVVNFGNTHFTQGQLRVSGNTLFDSATGVVDIDTALLDITANVAIEAATMLANVNLVTIGTDATDNFAINSNTVFNSDVLIGADATTLFEVNSNTVFNNDVLIGENESDVLTVNANTVINNDMYIGTDFTDTLLVVSTSTFNNDVVLGSSSDDSLIVHSDADFNANVNIDGVLSTTNNVILGSDGTDTLVVNATSDFNANVNIDGILTTTNNVILGSDGTDTLVVNATSDFNANVNIDGILTATNNATIGSDGTDIFTVNADTNFNANVTIGDAEADILDVNSTTTFNNNVTIGSDSTDDLLVNANTGFVNNVTIGSDGTDTVVINSVADFNANVNVDGIVTLNANVTIGNASSDTLIVNANTLFTHNVTIGNSATDVLTITADVGSDILPSANSTHNLGALSARWDNIYVDDATVTANVTAQTAIIRDITPTIVGKNSATGYPQLTVQLDANNGSTSNVVSFSTTAITPQTATIALGSATEKFLSAYFASNTFITAAQTQLNSTTLTVNGTQFNISANTSITNDLNVTGSTVLAVTEVGELDATANVNVTSSVNITERLVVTGATTLNANATISATLIPGANTTYDLGTSTARFANIYVDDFVSDNFTLVNLNDVANSANAGDILVANTSGGFEFTPEKKTLLSLTDVPDSISAGDILVANTSGGFEFSSLNTSIKGLSDVPDTANAGDILVANTTGGFDFIQHITSLTDLDDTPANVTDGNVLVGNSSGGYEARAYINQIVDLTDVLESTPANAEVLTYIADAGGFEFRSVTALSADFSLSLDDLTDVDTGIFEAGYIIIANTSNQWEGQKLQLGLLTDVNELATAGQVLQANSSGGYDFKDPSTLVSIALEDLTDVDVTGAANGEVLTANSTGGYTFESYGWRIDDAENSLTGDTISNGKNVNFFGSNNISVSVTSGVSGQINVDIFQNNAISSVNDLTDAVTYNAGVSIGVGTDALSDDDATTNYNTAFGYRSLRIVTSGSGNVGVGANAGDNITTGFNNIVIGRSAQASAFNAENEITLGNASIQNLRIPGIGLNANSSVITWSGGDVATEAFVNTSISTAISNLLDSAPETLDTLNELAAALGDDPNFATTITTALSTKATLNANVAFNVVTVETLNANTINTTSAVVGQTITSTAGLIDLNGWQINAGQFQSANVISYNDASHEFTGDLDVSKTLTAETLSANNITATSVINGQVSSISNHDTADLSEGTNLYYTVARANTAIDARVTKLFVDALNLDADTLDGIDSTSFLRSDQDDIMTGQLTVVNTSSGATPYGLFSSTALSTQLILHNTGTGSAAIEFANANGGAVVQMGRIRVTGTGSIFYSGTDSVEHKLWHAGNDGSGSGLDADLLDGVNSGSFLRSDQDDTFTGNLTINGSLLTNNQSSLGTQQQPFGTITAGVGVFENESVGVPELLLRDKLPSGAATLVLAADAASAVITGDGTGSLKIYTDASIIGGLSGSTLSGTFDTTGLTIAGSLVTENKGSLGTQQQPFGTITAGVGVFENDSVSVPELLLRDKLVGGEATLVLSADAASAVITGDGTGSFKIYTDAGIAGNLSGSTLSGTFDTTGLTLDGTLTAGNVITSGSFDFDGGGTIASGDALDMFTGEVWQQRGAISTPDNKAALYITDSAPLFGTSGGFVLAARKTSTDTYSNAYLAMGNGVCALGHDQDFTFWHSPGGASTVSTSTLIITTEGNVTAAGNMQAIDFNSTSDARIKENVVTIDNALDKVCNMRGVYYNRIGEIDKQVGVIAQEIEAIIPELVRTNTDDLKTVSYGNIVGVLIEAIKDLKAEINNLNDRIDDMQ